MKFQITPLPEQPKKRAEMILKAEYSKIFCFSVFSYHQPKQGISVILSAAGKNNNLDSFFPVSHWRFILFSISKL